MGRKPKTTESLAVSVTVSLPMDLVVTARKAASAQGASFSLIVRRLLEGWLGGNAP